MAGVPVRVLVADDQQLTAAGTTAALDACADFELVGVAVSAAQAGEFAEATQPDVALVHVDVPGGGAEAVRAILAGSPDTRVLAHSRASDHEAVIVMLRAGAEGYVLRDSPGPRLMEAISGAAAGDTILDGVVGGSRAAKRARIRGVIDRSDIDIVFQPIVVLDSRETVGYEALSRFDAKPRRGPAVWFAEAHDVGLGPELELLAVRLACERAHAIPKGMFMAVNVSPVTTERPELLELLVESCVDHVVLEVTEHARVEDYGRFRRALSRVREVGAELAVDDAGAGFASLRHILELNAELIKLDGSLTRSLEADPRRRALASALIEFGRESGASVLAEHVESELQLIELRRLGVHYGQGYHLGRPAPLPVHA
jgi:EAL domain-containing protein (putative c-di-GMP-specific phosphodiesterase class I)/CheY-like chemotaxis protein